MSQLVFNRFNIQHILFTNKHMQYISIDNIFEQHLNNFKDLKKLTESINRVCEGRLITYLLGAVPVFGLYFTEILDGQLEF